MLSDRQQQKGIEMERDGEMERTHFQYWLTSFIHSSRTANPSITLDAIKSATGASTGSFNGTVRQRTNRSNMMWFPTSILRSKSRWQSSRVIRRRCHDILSQLISWNINGDGDQDAEAFDTDVFFTFQSLPMASMG